MDLSAVLGQLSQGVIEGDAEAVKKLTRDAVAQEAHDLGRILNEGLISGMAVVGERFKIAEYFLPEVLMAAQAMKAGMEILEPLLAREGIKPGARILMGSVQNDIHDIGKNLVEVMLRGAGFQVIDLGIDVPPKRFVEAAKETGAQIVGMSALTSGTMPFMKSTIEAFVSSGFRAKVKITVGGAVVTAAYAESIGADGYARDAVSAVTRVRELLGPELLK